MKKVTAGSEESSLLSTMFKTKVDLSKRITEVEGSKLYGLNSKTKEKEVIYLEEFASSADRIHKLLLNNNNLTRIPSSFLAPLSQLKSLNLSQNQLSYIPEEVCTLVRLEVLHLEENKLEVLPSRIGKLTNLQKLFVQRNQLNDLPEEICTLTGLKVLQLEDNNLKKLPFKLGYCAPQLKTISVKGNPLISPPMFICMTGTTAILRYLSSMQNMLRQAKPQKFLFKYQVEFTTDDTKKPVNQQQQQ